MILFAIYIQAFVSGSGNALNTRRRLRAMQLRVVYLYFYFPLALRGSLLSDINRKKGWQFSELVGKNVIFLKLSHLYLELCTMLCSFMGLYDQHG
ncbi:hypothetical protein BDV59DRAFT_184696 [Aspergillus ambiguus]|uniref:uncharacterized protein n=1 Tax=Aspergillus ambiguus TaxID=176160 RepID=UPI003CCC9ECA